MSELHAAENSSAGDLQGQPKAAPVENTGGGEKELLEDASAQLKRTINTDVSIRCSPSKEDAEEMGNCSSQPTATVSEEGFVNEKSTTVTNDYIATKMSAEGLTDSTSSTSFEKKEDFLGDPLGGIKNDGLLSLSFDDNPLMTEVEKELNDDKNTKGSVEPPGLGKETEPVVSSTHEDEELNTDATPDTDSSSAVKNGDPSKSTEEISKSITQENSAEKVHDESDAATEEDTKKVAEVATECSAIGDTEEATEDITKEDIEVTTKDAKEVSESASKDATKVIQETTEVAAGEAIKEDSEVDAEGVAKEATDDSESNTQDMEDDLPKTLNESQEVASEAQSAKEVPKADAEEEANLQEYPKISTTEEPAEIEKVDGTELSTVQKDDDAEKEVAKTGSNISNIESDKEVQETEKTLQEAETNNEPEKLSQQEEKDKELTSKDDKGFKEVEADSADSKAVNNDENTTNDTTPESTEVQEKPTETTSRSETATTEEPAETNAIETTTDLNDIDTKEEQEDTNAFKPETAPNDFNDEKPTDSSDSESETSSDDSVSTDSSSDEDSETESAEQAGSNTNNVTKEPSAIEKEAMVYKVATGKKAIEARGPGARKAAKEDSSSGSDSSSSDSSDSDDEPQIYLFTSLTSGDRRVMGDTHRLHTMLKASDIDFTVVDIATNERAKRLWRLRGKNKRLPAVIREDEIVGGYDEMDEANESGFLREVVLEDEIMP